MRRLRTFVTASLATTALMLSGCGTPNSQKVREEANDRVMFVKAQLHFDQANQAFSTGQLEKALREVETAIAMFDKHAPYYVLLGRVYLETHRLEMAMRSFEAAQEIAPNLPEAHYFAGIVNQRWSRYEEAADCYLRAYELKPENPQYLLAAAEAFITIKRYSEAERLVSSKLSYFEHNAAMRQLLAQLAILQGDASRAATLYREARTLSPEDLLLFEELARAEFSAGQFAQCLHSVRQIMSRIGEKRPDLLHLEARCLTMMDQTTEARNVYLELTRVTPTNADVWIELGNLAYAIGDFTRVAQAGVQAIAIAPERFEGYLLKGLFERQRGRTTEALVLLKQAATLAPDSAMPHMVLGSVLAQSGDLDGAIASYGRAVRIDPENSRARAMLNEATREATVIASEPIDGSR